MFSINALLYGDFRHLAERCLESISYLLIPGMVSDVRIGLNEPGEETRKLLAAWLETIPLRIPVMIFESDPPANVFKYPLMRRMFYEPGAPTPMLTMWFDDDSYVLPGWKDNGAKLLESIQAIFEAPSVGMCGELFTKVMEAGQWDWIQARPWYRGRQHLGAHANLFRFATGGWWTARTAILRTFDWPDPTICHNGGDTALGELMFQQCFEIASVYGLGWVRVNDAKRRGASQRPAGHIRNAATLDHQAFKHSCKAQVRITNDFSKLQERME